ncbi:MAG: hypothetical protein ABIH47_10030 [Candidatus Omnitrophota bacterium]
MVNFVWSGKYEQQGVLVMRYRHKKMLEKALMHIRDAYLLFKQKGEIELLSCDLRDALNALKELVGEIYSDEILNSIFNEFCVGK